MGAGTDVKAEPPSGEKQRTKGGEDRGSISPACPRPGSAGAWQYIAAGYKGNRLCVLEDTSNLNFMLLG